MTVVDGVMLFLFFVIFGGAFASLMGFRPNLRRWNPAKPSHDGGTGGGRNRGDDGGGSDGGAGDGGGGGGGD
ncbi:MAG: hypothetical protein AAFV45_11075 [Pseudomonadota bacterium]